MILAELLLGGDPARERWVAAGAGLIAVDSLVHAFLHRTGILRRLGAEHPYGDACYRPGGCAATVAGLADRESTPAPTTRASRPAFRASFSTRFGCSAPPTAGTPATATGSMIEMAADGPSARPDLTATGCPTHAKSRQVGLGRTRLIHTRQKSAASERSGDWPVAARLLRSERDN